MQLWQSGILLVLQNCFLVQGLRMATPLNPGPGSQAWEGVQEMIRDHSYLKVNTPSLKISCMSDLHTDYKGNLEWINTWPDTRGDGATTVLIVAGDISCSLEKLEESFVCLQARYNHIVFVPGNHDLWTEGSNTSSPSDSATKLKATIALCRRIGVIIDPAHFMVEGGGQDIWLVPLYSWYHASWDIEQNIGAANNFTKRWGDFLRCKWPETLCSQEEFKTIDGTSTALADAFGTLNDEFIAKLPDLKNSSVQPPLVISLSHFLPRIELCPEKRYLKEPYLTKVIGSDPLERQVREIGSDVHIFGHTHISIDMEVEGVRYLQWPLGSVGEQSRQTRQMKQEGPMLLYDSSEQGLAPIKPTMWGNYYRENERNPDEGASASWALQSGELTEEEKEQVLHETKRVMAYDPY
ncbi:unnamed protein product [Chrysoparadoxa australica]